MNFKWKGEKKKEENSALQFDVLLATNCSKWAYYRVDTVFCLPETALCSGPGFLSLLSTKSVEARLTFLKHIHGFAVRPTFRPYFAEELLRSFTSYWVSTWHLRTEKLKWSTVPSCCAFYARSETLWNKSDIALVHSTSYYWPLRGCRSLGPPSGLAALGRTSWPATTQRPICNLSHAHTGDILYKVSAGMVEPHTNRRGTPIPEVNHLLNVPEIALCGLSSLFKESKISEPVPGWDFLNRVLTTFLSYTFLLNWAVNIL